MKIKILVFSLVWAVSTLFPVLMRVSAQDPRVQSQTAQVHKPVLSEKDALKNVRFDESPEVAAGILPDLTIKEMCLASGPAVPSETLRVLIANIGSRDADPFELGIKFVIYSEDSGFWHVAKLAGLKAGEEKWLEYRPMSGSGFTLAFVVERTVKFQVIADPSYIQGSGPLGIYLYEVKSKIAESNKRNNTLTIGRTEMRSCDSKNITRPAIPKIQTIKPVRP
jgi:hypothetical protein